MISFNILVVSDKYDFTTDYVCLELQQRKAAYLRINRDEFRNYKVTLDLSMMNLNIEINNKVYITDAYLLKSIYYRAPIYLRENYTEAVSKEEQLYNTQWMSFIRNLVIFEDAIWVNNPIATFKAENKLLQLKLAHNLGLLCPKTIITNTTSIGNLINDSYIIKSLDTALLKIGDNEAFVYSNIIAKNDFLNAELSLAPIVLQEYIYPKVDLRVTVIGNIAYSVEILKNGHGVDDDWRLSKDDVTFVPLELPNFILQKCIALVKVLNLSFGAIDLIMSNDEYYFIEINPTGEWAWLVETAGLNIPIGICDFLLGRNI